MDTRKAFLGVGWAMPVAVDPQTGFIATVAYEDDIQQAIRIILETSPGERVMRPDFGCGIHDLVFAAIDSTAIERIRSVVTDALRRFEARIELLDITVDENADVHGQVKIELDYRVRRTNQRDNMVFPFYFKEGGAA